MNIQAKEKREQTIQCEICSGQTQDGLDFWLRRCTKCGLLTASLDPYTDCNDSSGYAFEEHSVAFETLRKHNAEACVALIKTTGVHRSRLLEVGSAQGFFLEVASKYGFDCTGIEPNNDFCKLSQNKGLNVIPGFFPKALSKDQKFDIIIFNDVFEHIPEARSTLQQCYDSLEESGLLVLNLPMSNGFFYRLSTWFYKLGWKVPFQRMWQVGTMSPHLYYFNEDNLIELATQVEFTPISRKSLKSVSIKGLWSRLRVSSDSNIVTASIIWIGTVLVSPVLAILPADTAVIIFKKKTSDAPS